jgi:tetratricopeptide (TPR) repeat protein
MKGYTNNSLIGTLRNERGSSAFTFAGYAIIIVVVIGAFLLFKSGDFGKQTEDKNYVSGINALKNNQLTEAVSLFSKSITAKPDNVSAYLGRSRANVRLGKLDKALEDANTAIQKKPSAQAYGQKAIIEKIQKKNDEAIKDFSKAIEMDPSFAWAYAQRADMFFRQNEQEKALKDISKAISLKSDFVDALRLRAWIHNRNGKCKEAAQDFVMVEKLSPKKDAWTMQDRAWFLLTCPDEKIQDTAKAMELAKEADKLTAGKDGVVQETLAEAFFKKGDFVSAVAHQQKAVELGSIKCPDGSCLKEMQQRLQKYEMAARQETRTNYEVLPMDSGL